MANPPFLSCSNSPPLIFLSYFLFFKNEAWGKQTCEVKLFYCSKITKQPCFISNWKQRFSYQTKIDEFAKDWILIHTLQMKIISYPLPLPPPFPLPHFYKKISIPSFMSFQKFQPAVIKGEFTLSSTEVLYCPLTFCKNCMHVRNVILMLWPNMFLANEISVFLNHQYFKTGWHKVYS